MQPNQRSLNLPLLAIVAEGFCSRLSFGLVSFALPLYTHRLGLSLAEIGLLTSLNLVVAITLKPAMGWAADHFGLKRSFTAAVGLRSIVALLLAFAGSLWQLYAIRAMHGLSTSLREPAANALIAEHGGKKAIASAFAWYQTAKSVAGALGKAVAGLLLTVTASNFSLVFLVAFVLSALPIFVVARFVADWQKEDAAKAPQHPESSTLPSSQEPLPATSASSLRPTMLPFIILAFLFNNTAQMLKGLFPVLAVEYAGLTEAQTGSIYMVSTLVILFSGPLFGWLSDNVSREIVLMVRGAANITSSIIYIVAPNFLGVASGKLTDDVGKAAFRPAWGSLMAYISGFDRNHRARTMSILSMGEDAGKIAGPILAGFLWQTWGLPLLFGVRIVLAIVAEIYTLTISQALNDDHDSPQSPS